MPAEPNPRDPRREPSDVEDAWLDKEEVEQDHYTQEEMMEHLRRVRHSTQEQGLKSKKKRRRRSHQPILVRRRRRVMFALAFLIIGLPVLTFIGGSYLFSYLHFETDTFRKDISQAASEWLGVQGEFETNFEVSQLKFQNQHFQGINASRSSVLAEVEMQNIEAHGRFGSMMSDAWQVSLLRCDEGLLRFRDVMPEVELSESQENDAYPILRAGLGFHGVPGKLLVERFAANRLNVFFGSGTEPRQINEGHFIALKTDKGYEIDIDHGTFQFGHWPIFQIGSVRMKYLAQERRFEFVPNKDSLVVAEKGDDAPGTCGFSGGFSLGGKPKLDLKANIERIKLEDLVKHNSWGKSLMGLLEGAMTFTGGLTTDAPLEIDGDLAVVGLAIKNLPILDGLENYCGVSAMKRIEFDKLKFRLVQRGREITLKDIHGRNPDYLAVVGSITIHADSSLEGELEIGLPDSIWEKKDQQSNSRRVVIARPSFFEPRPGDAFSWTRVKIGGALERPEDDLISRFHQITQGTNQDRARKEAYHRPSKPEDGKRDDFNQLLERVFDNLVK